VVILGTAPFIYSGLGSGLGRELIGADYGDIGESGSELGGCMGAD
jgi:hypothetical protein